MTATVLKFPQERVVSSMSERMGYAAFYKAVPYVLNPYSPIFAALEYSQWAHGWLRAQWEAAV